MAKYETTVASTATSLYEIEGNTSQNLVGGLSFQHDWPHIPNMLQYAYNGLAVRLHQAYNYGRDEYTYGLPGGFEELIGDPDVAAVEAAIEAELGYPVQIHSIYVGAPEDLFVAQRHSWLHWGYKHGNGILHNPPIAPRQGANVSISDTLFNPSLNLVITMDIGYGDEEDVLVERSELDPLIDQSKLYYHVRYTNQGATTPNHSFWMYEVGSGVHPDLDSVEYADLDSPYMPIVPIRQDNKNMGPKVADGEFVLDEDGNRIVPDTELYRTSVKLCDKMDTDFDQLCREITTNPDVDEMDHVYLIYGVDIRTIHDAGKDYIYSYFEDLSVKGSGARTIVIRDAYYNIHLSFSNATRQVVTGSLSSKHELHYSGNTLTARKDLGDGTYGEVIVYDLVHTNYVYEGHAVVTDLAASADPENYNFIVPLNIDIFNSIRGLFRRQDLLKESYKLVVNSYQRRKLKWYETRLFKFVVLIVCVVATIYSLGQFGAAMMEVYAATQSLSAALLAGVQMVLTGLTVKLGVSWLVSQLSPELALVVATVLAVTSIASVSFGADIGLLDAEQMLGLTNATIEGVQMGVQDELGEITAEMEEFQKEADAAQEELDELWAELDTSVDWFDALIVQETTPTIYEEPDEYFNRTLHAGNIGVATLSLIENYVDSALALPELKTI